MVSCSYLGWWIARDRRSSIVRSGPMDNAALVDGDVGHRRARKDFIVDQVAFNPGLDPIATVERHLGLGPAEIATIVGVAESVLGSVTTLPQPAERRLRALVALAERVDDTFEPAGAEGWLTAPNRALRGAVPLAELRAGHLDAVEAALEAIDSGVYV